MRHFDKFESNTQNFVRNFYYMYKYWIDHNFGLSKNQTITILKAVEVNKNNELTLKQIKQIEQQYNILSKIIYQYKQKLTSTPNFNSTSNPEFTTVR